MTMAEGCVGCDLENVVAVLFVVSVSSVLTVQVVELETISTEFGMRCSEVISEIQELEAQSRLTGILDERGKVRMPIWYLSNVITKWGLPNARTRKIIS